MTAKKGDARAAKNAARDKRAAEKRARILDSALRILEGYGTPGTIPEVAELMEALADYAVARAEVAAVRDARKYRLKMDALFGKIVLIANSIPRRHDVGRLWIEAARDER